jgi:hypothetical protein
MTNSASTFRITDTPNTLREPQIASDAKTQIRCIVPRCAFCGMRTGPTRATKILRRHFTPQTHQNAPRDMQITLEILVTYQQAQGVGGILKPALKNS